jgi:hypothetical protein
MSSPSYDEIISTITGSGQDEWIHVGDLTGGGRAVYKPDPRISLTVEIDLEDRSYSESWANSQADSTAYRADVAIRFNGQVIREDLVVSVDGGRAHLLAPEHLTIEEGNYTWGYDAEQYAWASAIGLVMNDKNRFDEYVSRCGLGTPTSEPRSSAGARERSAE